MIIKQPHPSPLVAAPAEISWAGDASLEKYLEDLRELLATDSSLTQCYYNFQQQRGFLAFSCLFKLCSQQPILAPISFWDEFIEGLVPTLPTERLTAFLLSTFQKSQQKNEQRLALQLARLLPDEQLTLFWQACLNDPRPLQQFASDWQGLFSAWTPAPEIHYPLIKKILQKINWAFLQPFLLEQLGKLGDWSAQEILWHSFLGEKVDPAVCLKSKPLNPANLVLNALSHRKNPAAVWLPEFQQLIRRSFTVILEDYQQTSGFFETAYHQDSLLAILTLMWQLPDLTAREFLDLYNLTSELILPRSANSQDITELLVSLSERPEEYARDLLLSYWEGQLLVIPSEYQPLRNDSLFFAWRALVLQQQNKQQSTVFTDMLLKRAQQMQLPFQKCYYYLLILALTDSQEQKQKILSKCFTIFLTLATEEAVAISQLGQFLDFGNYQNQFLTVHQQLLTQLTHYQFGDYETEKAWNNFYLLACQYGQNQLLTTITEENSLKRTSFSQSFLMVEHNNPEPKLLDFWQWFYNIKKDRDLFINSKKLRPIVAALGTCRNNKLVNHYLFFRWLDFLEHQAFDHAFLLFQCLSDYENRQETTYWKESYEYHTYEFQFCLVELQKLYFAYAERRNFWLTQKRKLFWQQTKILPVFSRATYHC